MTTPDAPRADAAEGVAMAEIERHARAIAARKMGLVKDPLGLKLPDDLWRQAIPDVRALRDAVVAAAVAWRNARRDQSVSWIGIVEEALRLERAVDAYEVASGEKS